MKSTGQFLQISLKKQTLETKGTRFSLNTKGMVGRRRWQVLGPIWKSSLTNFSNYYVDFCRYLHFCFWIDVFLCLIAGICVNIIILFALAHVKSLYKISLKIWKLSNILEYGHINFLQGAFTFSILHPSGNYLMQT